MRRKQPDPLSHTNTVSPASRSAKAAHLDQGRPSPPISKFDSEDHSSTDYLATDDDNWGDVEEDQYESDYVSAGHEIEAPPPPHYPPSAPQSRVRTRGGPSGRHQEEYYTTVQYAPPEPSTVDLSDEFDHYGQYPPQHYGQGMQRRGHPQQYPPAHGGGYGYPGNQMVQQGYNNPFSPMSGSSTSSGYFGHQDPRMYPPDMMPYHHQHPSYYRGGQAALPQYLQQFHITPHAPPPPHDQSLVPAPSESPNPETLALKAELERMRKEKEDAARLRRQQEEEEKARKKEEEEIRRRMEEMKIMQENNRIELEKAKAEAERTARERIEAERKADEQRRKEHAEAMRQAEEKARIKFEAEMKAAEARRKKEEEARKQAEEAAKIRLEMAIRAEAEARAAAEKKAKEEEEKLKAIKEEAKRKAEADAAAKVEKEKEAEKKKAADAAAAKASEEALKKKIEAETKAKLEADAKTGEKAPIRFKDALGRKFSFPFRLCCTWQGMEDLIKQAFQGVDGLGPQVYDGCYDLLGPDGQIILASVWEKTIQPDWAITMAMWPPPPPRGVQGHGRVKHRGAGGIPVPPPAPGMGRGGIVPPPMWRDPGVRGRPMPDIEIVDVPGPSEKAKKKANRNSFAGFFAGKPAKSSSKK